jgi:HD-GYP domain-containing protein (c-di-GMP phosphodiesterase class II)
MEEYAATLLDKSFKLENVVTLIIQLLSHLIVRDTNLKITIEKVRNEIRALTSKLNGTDFDPSQQGNQSPNDKLSNLEFSIENMKHTIRSMGFDENHPRTRDLDSAARYTEIQRDRLRKTVSMLQSDSRRIERVRNNYHNTLTTTVDDIKRLQLDEILELEIKEGIEILKNDINLINSAINMVRINISAIQDGFMSFKNNNSTPKGDDMFSPTALSAAGIDQVGMKVLPGGYGDNGCEEFGKKFHFTVRDVNLIFPEKRNVSKAYWETYPLTMEHVKLFNRLLDMAPEPTAEYNLVHRIIRKRLRENVVISNPIIGILSQAAGNILRELGLTRLIDLYNRRDETMYLLVRELQSKKLI